ncbi:MAG: CPBP family intramembrane metalloprotease [Acidobacteria bacterium]|nr:CPBP family intramembrane metalloprotease [Acidobacteriota bacterium]
MQHRTVRQPLAEIVALAGLLTSYIWFWAGTFGGDFTLCVILYLGIGLAAHIRAGEGPADLGLRLDTFGRAGREALLATIPVGLVLAGAGALLGSLHFPALPLWPRSLRDGIVWGALQQYGLLAVFYRRFCEMLPGRRRPLLAASAAFALLHLPNPFLTLATFGAGALSCWLFRRSPNLIVLGIMHGVISFLISAALPDTITMGMRVGPGFFRFVPGR